MRVLALDSAFGGLSVALAEDRRIVCARNGAPDAKAAEALPELVADCMSASSWRFGDLDRIAVTLGPGGFTSLRAGLAFAKGLALAANTPLLGFTTLEALAASVPSADAAIAAAIDAKRDEVFLQLFDAGLTPLTEPAIVGVADLPKTIAWPGRFRACGSGAYLLAGIGGALVEHCNVSSPEAAALALHCQGFAPGERPAEAVYLRPADARPAA